MNKPHLIIVLAVIIALVSLTHTIYTVATCDGTAVQGFMRM